MQKLDWLPLYIDNLLSSPAWLDMRDYQRGWYIQLLLRSTRSERLGYLPLDGQLWRLAGAHSRAMWDSHSADVMTCFKVRQFDGLDWIYNPKLLGVMEDQSTKYRKRVPLISPIISDVAFGKSTSKPDPIPDGLHQMQYGARICDELGLPKRGNMEMVASAIEALSIKEKLSMKDAYEKLLAAAQAAIGRGNVVDKWWFQDAKWRKNGTGQPSKAQQRQQSNRDGLTAALRSRYGNDGGESGGENGQGTDGRGQRGLVRVLRKGAGTGD